MELLNICIKQNFLKFNGDTYTQTEGLAMGPPLPQLLADRYMDSLKKTILLQLSKATSNFTKDM